MPRDRTKTHSATPVDAVAYLAKAREFLPRRSRLSRAGQLQRRYSNAVHAGIAAADAIAAGRSGVVWSGDHDQAALHVETTSEEGRQAARHLRRLLTLKTRAEYDPAPMRAPDAQVSVKGG